MRELSREENLQLARFALDHAEEAAFWTDTDGRFLYVNDSASRSLAYSPDELLQMTLFQVSPELTPAMWTQLWKETKASSSFAFEFTQIAKDGRTFPVEMTARHLQLGEREFLCVSFRDVNERKRLQQLKNEFVSTVSHELRTPTTIIREGVSQVLDGLWGDVSTRQREVLSMTLTAIDRLARIISDLLDVSKMEAGKVTLRWELFNLGGLVQEVIDTFASRANERDIQLRAHLPKHRIEICADRDRIAQVLTNLVGNALKFSEKGTVEIAVLEKKTAIECSVSDTGIGIAPGDMGRVFNKFEQFGQTAFTGEKGTGLGLSICKGIIELHQGQIWVQSEVNRGSTFTFALPRRSVRDLFKQRILEELKQAISVGGALSTILFEITPPSPSVVEDLTETLKTHGVRKTDIVMKDASAVWVGLRSTVKKEASRITERILEAFNSNLSRKPRADAVRVSWTLCSYPEDIKTEYEFIKRFWSN